MQTQYPTKDLNVAYWCHLLACLLATLLLGLFMVFGVAQASPALFVEPQAWSLLLALAGLVVIWWKDLLGGSLTLIGMAFFYGLNLIQTGQPPGGWVFPVFIVGGLLAVLSGVLNRRAGRLQKNS